MLVPARVTAGSGHWQKEESTTPPDLRPFAYAPGTTLRFDRYTIEDGLSQSVAKCLLHDSQGFVWIGTEDGLNRFDGYTFTIYRPDPDDPDSLSNANVTALYEDDSGELWIGTYGGGLNRYDPVTGRFTAYRHDPGDANSLSEDQVLAVHGDSTGAVWAGTRDGGLNRLDPVTGQWQRFGHDPDQRSSISSNTVRAIAEHPAGTLWVGTAGGLERLDLKTGAWRSYHHDPDDPTSLTSSSITALSRSSPGYVWIGTAGGLNRFDINVEIAIHYEVRPGSQQSLSDSVVRSVLEGSSGEIWIGTDAGLDRLDLNAGTMSHYRYDPSDPHSLGSSAVRALVQDRAGGLWVGTYGGGLNRHDPLTEQFAHFRHDPSDGNTLSNNSIWSIHQDPTGVLWVGTSGGGLNRLGPSLSGWRHYRADPENPLALSSDSVTTIYRDESGALWLGTQGGGLNRLDPATGLFTRFQSQANQPDSLSSNYVWVVRGDRSGALWVGTTSGLNRMDPRTEEFTRYYHDPDDPSSLSGDDVGSIFIEQSGLMWVGTHDGLNRFDPATGRAVRYQHDPDDPSSLSHNIVFAIHEDREGALWLGTWGGGLNRFDRESEIFTRYRVRDGLPNDVVYGILEDEQGHLWLSTNRGLSRFDPSTETFRNYDARDGLQSNEFNFGAYHRGEGGQMFFGGINGLNVFDPKDLRDNTYVPPVALTSLNPSGGPANATAPPPARTFAAFEWPDNDFQFEFAALSFHQAEDNRYAYLLEGYDKDWNWIGARRSGGYTNLPGGDYILRLMGSNNDGYWNEEGKALTITIVPPFWATWWFRGALALALAAIVAGVFALRVRSVRRQSLDLERQVASRTKELSALNAIAIAVSSSLDLDQVLADALDKTLEVMSIEAGGIYLLQRMCCEEEGGLLTVAVHRGLDPELVESIDNLVVGEGLSGRVVQTGEPMQVRDVGGDPRLTRSMVRDSGFNSVAITPVVARSVPLGTLFVMTRRRTEFSERDMELLSSIGGQIGVAIENARFFEAQQHRAEQFRVIAEVGRRVTLHLGIEEVLTQIVRLVQKAFGYYHVAIGLVEDGEVAYHVGAGPLWDSPGFSMRPARLKIGEEGISGWVAAAAEPLLIPDVSAEPRYVPMEGCETRSELAVPIIVKEEVIGVLDLQSDKLDDFDDTDVNVFQSLAHQAGAAIENARLYAQAQQAAVVEERGRLARDLHDAVTQTLFSASLISEAVPAAWAMDREEGAELLEELRMLTRGALAEMRTLLLELRPAALIETDLGDLLRQLGEAASGREGLPVEVTVDGQCRLPSEVHVALYRIAQEALNNVGRHARARNVQASLSCVGPGKDGAVAEGDITRVTLRIGDDGRGFDPDRVPPNHLGLGIMRERAEKIGAELTIETEPGAGTTVTAVWQGTP
jgi:ligand-binding sensor domain-containing protein/signal transduction histidine kinase